MARRLRIELGNAFWHITLRANQRNKVFYDGAEREKLLEVLMRTKEIGGCIGIKRPVGSEAIKRLEGRLVKDVRIREKIEFLKKIILSDF